MNQRLETLSGNGAVLGDGPPEGPFDAYLYRYRLWRNIDGRDGTEPVLFVMLNPSTADHTLDDPTIRRCAGFARRLGAGRLEVVNLFAFRAMDPVQLRDFIGDVVGPENDEHIAQAARESRMVICAWGANVPKRPSANGRVQQVLRVLREAGHDEVYCLGETKAGHPKHPLYLAANTPLQAYDG